MLQKHHHQRQLEETLNTQQQHLAQKQHEFQAKMMHDMMNMFPQLTNHQQ
jgi:hypothetical protein